MAGKCKACFKKFFNVFITTKEILKSFREQVLEEYDAPTFQST